MVKRIDPTIKEDETTAAFKMFDEQGKGYFTFK